MTAIASAEHYPALDGLRGIAILAVLAFHFNLMHPVELDNSIDRFASGLFNAGWCGVDLFFVLSGFLITRILYDAKEDPKYFRNFYARRFLRIFPLYYAVLFLTFIVIPQLPSNLIPPEKMERWVHADASQIWYWLYLSNFSIMVTGWSRGILDVTWTLSIEEQFYLLWPLAVYRLHLKRLLHVCVFVFVTAFLIRLYMTMHAINPISIRIFTIGRLDVLSVGAFIALLTTDPFPRFSSALARRIWIITAIALIGVASLRRTVSDMDPLIQTVGFSLIAVNYGALLMMLLGLDTNQLTVRWISSDFLKSLGRYSYAMYLFHMPVTAFVRDSNVFGSRLFDQLLFFAVTGTLVFALALISWHLWESPFLQLKRHFPLVGKRVRA